jgi:malonyl-CoA decarboxylase
VQALRRACEAPRHELFRRLNTAPGGTRAIVALRTDLLAELAAHPELRAVDTDLHDLLTGWFNPGFLTLTRRRPALCTAEGFARPPGSW